MNEPGIPSELSVVDALAQLRAEGFTADLALVDGQVRCGACGIPSDPGQWEIHALHRFEGASDPGEEAIVLALVCPSCAVRGVAVATYGPEMGTGESDALRGLVDRRRG